MSKWNLNDIFKTEEEFINTRNLALEMSEQMLKYKGDLLKNINEVLNTEEEIILKIMDALIHATKKFHLNMKESSNIQSISETENVFSQIRSNTAWIAPEMITYNKEDIFATLTDSNKDKFSHYINKMFANKDYILSDKEEELLVKLDKVKSDFADTYNALTIADRKPVKVQLSDREVEVSSGNYTSLLTELENQDDRRKVFEAHFQFYVDNSTTLSNLYNNVINLNVDIFKTRGYQSAIEAKLSSDKIPLDVYHALLRNAKKQVHILKEYLDYKKDSLGLRDIYTYDRMLKVNYTDKKYSYEEGKDLVLTAAASASKEYRDLVEYVLQDGWIDVFPDENKITGAYSWGSYNTHPIILHNYDDSLNAVYTLIHEAGHSIHTHLASKNQTFYNASYPIFLAEIPSTFAECILSDYLLKNESDEQVKKVLLEQAVINIIGTYFRQTLFADFEYQTHKLVEEGKTLTSDVLCDIMNSLYKEYYDMELSKEELKKFVWAYIPHLIKTPFYVYQYSTCLTASLALYNKYVNNKEEGLNALFDILKKGGSDYPNKILTEAGIDLSKDETYDAVGIYLKDLIDNLKK